MTAQPRPAPHTQEIPMNVVLVTGFSPFDGEPVNPSLEAVRRLDGRSVAQATLVARELPVSGQGSLEAMIQWIQALDPVLVLAVGQAGGRAEISVERVALNLDDYRIPDQDGRQPIDEPVIPGGPNAYWAALPIKAMVTTMRANGIPAAVSNTAGSYVCNHLFYGLMHHLASEGGRRRGGFVHIPYLPEQAARLGGGPSMGLETIVRGLEVALEAAMTHPSDDRSTAGTFS
jgi:pyroglutamyl-peptidase